MDRIDSQRVKKLRLDKGWTQGELARRIGGTCTQQNVNQLENHHTGGAMPRYAQRLPAALETTWEYLTGKTDNPVGPIDPSLTKNSHGASNDRADHPLRGGGQEGYMLNEISTLLGRMEGRMEAQAEVRFKTINQKLDDHERRLSVLEDAPIQGPQKGRRR